MAAAGEDAEADGEFLDHVQDGDEDELLQEQAVAPLHAALAGGDDAADIGVGEHDDEAGPEDGHGAGEAGVGRHRRGTPAAGLDANRS